MRTLQTDSTICFLPMQTQLLSLSERSLIWLFIVILILKISYIASNGLELIGDESYYWDWSRKPDWCYYSKPPMVAWIIAVATALGGSSVESVRIPAALLNTLTLVYLYKTTSAFYSPKAGCLALLMLIAMPFNVLLGFIMTIDAPLCCFWAMSLYYLEQALFKQRVKAWLWAGCATGAAILSKQVALLLPLMVLSYLALDKSRRSLLLSPRFLSYLAPVLLSLIPIIEWNAQHDWVMYQHSKHHLTQEPVLDLSVRLGQIASFIGYQLLLVSPLLCVLVLSDSIKHLRQFKHLSAAEQFLTLTGPVLLAGIFILNLGQKTQGNWAVPFYFSAIILSAGTYSQLETLPNKLANGIKLGLGLVLVTYTLPLLISALGLTNSPLDPTSRFRYWRQLATQVDSYRQHYGRDAFIVTLGHRFMTSELAFYLPEQPQVYRYETTGQIASQYELWPGPNDPARSAYFIVEHEHIALPKAITSAFEHIQSLGQIENPLDPKNPYHVLFAQGLKQWPTLSRPD